MHNLWKTYMCSFSASRFLNPTTISGNFTFLEKDKFYKNNEDYAHCPTIEMADSLV